MAIQRFDVANGDDHGDLAIAASGSVEAGHVCGVEYNDALPTQDIHLALIKAAERILTLDPGA